MIGTTVVDRCGNRGRVVRMFDDFSAVSASCLTITGEEWLSEQVLPFTAGHLQEPWLVIECEYGGSAWSPASLVEEVW